MQWLQIVLNTWHNLLVWELMAKGTQGQKVWGSIPTVGHVKKCLLAYYSMFPCQPSCDEHLVEQQMNLSDK